MPEIPIIPGSRTEGTAMRTFDHKSYKSCKTCYLTVALFAAAAVFALCAPFAYGQEKRVAANPDKDDANMGPGIVVLRGDFSAYGSFFFRGNTITYKHGVRDKGSRPGRLKVNGKPYGDLKEPYKLDFKPDFAHAHLREQACDGTVELVVLDDGRAGALRGTNGCAKRNGRGKRQKVDPVQNGPDPEGRAGGSGTGRRFGRQGRIDGPVRKGKTAVHDGQNHDAAEEKNGFTPGFQVHPAAS